MVERSGGGMTTYYEMNDDFLAHYGVLGMKWGRRKAKASSGGSTKKTKKFRQYLGGTKFARNSILKNNRLTDKQKLSALEDNAYLGAKNFTKKNGSLSYDVVTKTYVAKNKKGKSYLYNSGLYKYPVSKIKNETLRKHYGG